MCNICFYLSLIQHWCSIHSSRSNYWQLDVCTVLCSLTDTHASMKSQLHTDRHRHSNVISVSLALRRQTEWLVVHSSHQAVCWHTHTLSLCLSLPVCLHRKVWAQKEKVLAWRGNHYSKIAHTKIDELALLDFQLKCSIKTLLRVSVTHYQIHVWTF